MESDETDTLVMYHINWYMYTHYKTEVVLLIYTQNKEAYTTQVQVPMSIYCSHAAGVSREVIQCIRQTAHNTRLPCQWPSHQIHRSSRGTPPWTADQIRLPGARLSLQHYHRQRGGPPSLGQGTQQQQDARPWHSRERHCILSALNNRNRLTTDHHLCTHSCRRTKEIDNSI